MLLQGTTAQIIDLCVHIERRRSEASQPEPSSTFKERLRELASAVFKVADAGEKLKKMTRSTRLKPH